MFDPADQQPEQELFIFGQQQAQPAAGGGVEPPGPDLEGLILIEEERGEPSFLVMGVPQHKPLPRKSSVFLMGQDMGLFIFFEGCLFSLTQMITLGSLSFFPPLHDTVRASRDY